MENQQNLAFPNALGRAAKDRILSDATQTCEMSGLQKNTTLFHLEFWTLQDMQGHFKKFLNNPNLSSHTGL